MSERTPVMGEDDRRRAQQLSIQSVRPPLQVPGYEPERFLGKGAFGEVWLATDLNTGRRVAVKFYAHREGLDWSPLTREVEKMRFLFSDRHVVQLLEVGWDADPPYFVMEYLEQGSLDEKLKRDGPMPANEAIPLFREVATGLMHAHRKGILHCDLKPANILLDQDGKPRLADFGQSRLSSDQAPALGTLFYMAPEQADLKSKPDPRWDVYALGAVFYQMLTGSPPHRTEEGATHIVRSTRLEERLERYREFIRETPMPREHRRAPGVSRGLAEIIERCLAYDPKERFPSVQAVLDALNAWTLRRARRALLVMGVVGPAMLLLVMFMVSFKAFETTMAESREAVTDRALESNRFAARFVAEEFALDVERRWRILEREAASPEFRKLFDGYQSRENSHDIQAKIQAWIEKQHANYDSYFKPATRAASWFVTDRHGTQLARSPRSDRTINHNYAHRDYFNGLGENLTPEEAARRHLRPIREPYRSVVFQSEANKHFMVGFSVPIRSADSKDKESLGVLCMTVELGHFVELHGTNNQIAVLVDTRPVSERNEAGLIAEHPAMREEEEATTMRFVSPEVVDRANRLQQHKFLVMQQRLEKHNNAAHVQDVPEMDVTVEDYRGDYEDPLAGPSTPWLATIEPVIVIHGRERVMDTGWIVLVQERYDKAMEPVFQMQQQLVHMALVALGLVALVILALWGFVILVLNDSVRSRITAALRRSVGLATVGSGSGRTGSRSSVRSAQEPSRTVLYDHSD